MTRLATNWSIAYSSATDAFTITYASTYAAQTVEASHLNIAAASDNDQLISIGADASKTCLNWSKCTSPVAASRTLLIAAIVALDTGAAVSLSSIETDAVNEKTIGNGVVVDGVLLKDNAVSTDTINELTTNTGVTIDGVLLRNTESFINCANMVQRSTDPGNSAGRNPIWASDGTDSGIADDILTINSGGTISLISCATPYVSSVYSSSDINWNGTTAINILSITLTAGTWQLTGRANLTGDSVGSLVVNISSASASKTSVTTEAQSIGYGGTPHRQDMTIITVVSPTTSTTYYLNAWLFGGTGSGVMLHYTLGQRASMFAHRLV